MIKGFVKKLLKVDLSTGKMEELPLDEEIAKSFLGGAGYCVKYLYPLINKHTDPLGPENVLMFMNGPFCGSNIPTSGRFTVCAKSPYTGLWGEANCGGYFGPELKKAGYDGLIFTGASENPVYLEITENGNSLKDAQDLWGKGIFETSKILKERSGSDLARIACIGPAGENLVKFATIASEDKAAGRTGMGAVMGSKNLKAISIKAKKRQYEPADPEAYKEIVKTVIENVNSSFTSQMFGMLGTGGGVDKYNLEGELPIKYWTQGTWEGAFNISGATASEQLFTRQYPCFSCPIGCAHKAQVKEGEYKTEIELESPEYETIVSFGSLILNDDLGAIVKANELCNDYGIDTISGGSAIAFIYYLFNKGKLKSEDIGNLEPNWGDIKSALELIKKIAFREDIGDTLAEGSNAVGKKFGIPQDEIATTLGMEVPYHDLRHTYGMAIGYAVGTTRGPCHCACDIYYILLGLPYEDLGIKFIDRQSEDEDMAENCAIAYDYRAFYNSLVMCLFCSPPPSKIIDLVKTSTGLDFDIDKLKEMGERIYTMKRLFNLKMGLTPDDEVLPKILLKPLSDGGSAGKSPNFEQLKQLYYNFRTFDPETGYPSQEKLKKLGLDDL